MTDLPPIEYLDEAARLHGYQSWDEASRCAGVFIRKAIIAHAHALHQLAQARAEIAALKPRETLEDVARREAEAFYARWNDNEYVGVEDALFACFLRGVQMQKEGELPDE